MNKYKYAFIISLILALTAATDARDLYKVDITCQADAELLESLNAEPVLRLHDGYLVLIDAFVADILEKRLPSARPAAYDIEIGQLAIDRRYDRANIGKYPLVFEQDNLRLFKIDWASAAQSGQAGQIMPIRNRNLRIEYHRPKIFNDGANFEAINFDSLINLVSRDSVEAYLYRLEAFHRRLTGTDSCYAARDWIASKFASFGYDSIVIDSFTGSQLWDRVPVPSQNVVATKIGTRYPDRQIIIGGHFDAVPDCPGADDNGTGTAGTLEMARVLKDIETEMTFIFIAFDSEESWMWGSYHYADSVGAEGKNIIYMQNLDMIGHITNNNRANLYYGPEMSYSRLWRELADSLVGITGELSGSTASDHLPFIQNGYDVTFVQEYDFSTHYHQLSDSTTYINFEYMTRMIKASLATVYTVNFVPDPITMISVLDVGDGQSLQVTWEPADPAQVEHYMLYFGTDPSSPSDSVYIPLDSNRYVLNGLTEGLEYFTHIIGYNDKGIGSLSYDQLSGIPYSIPAMPRGLIARPLPAGIRLDWLTDNRELDFDFYKVIRDGGLLSDSIYDSTFADWDANLGNDLHEYFVVAFDTDGNMSDTNGVLPTIMKAATLQEGKILAINRSGRNSAAVVDESVTGEFMREALSGYAYDYLSDTSKNRTDLLGMIDYGLIIIGAEGGRGDDIGNLPSLGGILDDIDYYLSIGGKAVIFGRWGDFSLIAGEFDTLFYSQASHFKAYNDKFHMNASVQPLSYIDASTAMIHSDFVGAHSLHVEYPDLHYDPIATRNHTGSAFTEITGIPCASFPLLRSGAYDILYTYDSSNDSIQTEGRPVAWRYLSDEYDYVFFHIPLSFIDRASAVAALQQAVNDLGLILAADDPADSEPIPDQIELMQNYPNPFNPRTVIEFDNPTPRPIRVKLGIFNILGQKITTLFDGKAVPGRHRIEWGGTDDKNKTVATGIYFYRLQTDHVSITRRMVLLK